MEVQNQCSSDDETLAEMQKGLKISNAPPPPPPSSSSSLSLSLSPSDLQAWLENNKSDTRKSLHDLTLTLPDNVEIIPDFIGDLVDLLRLTIKGNGSIKSLPSTLSRLCHLQTLDIISCYSLEELPESLKELASLRNLCIRGAGGLKSLPVGITGLGELLCLELQDCFNLESLPENLGDLVSLRQLRIRGAGLKCLPNGIAGLSKLQCLDVQDCFALEELPENLGDLVSLTDLSIRRSNIKSLPDTITKLPNLKTLRVEECCGIRELPPALNELVNVTHLSFRGSNIEVVPSTAAELHNLQVLDLRECLCLKDVPEELKLLVESRGLKLMVSFDEVAIDEVGPPLQMILNDNGSTPFDGKVNAKRGSLDKGRGAIVCASTDASEDTQLKAKPTWGSRVKTRLTLKDIEAVRSMTQDNAAVELGVSISTLKRRCQDLGIMSWRSHRLKKKSKRRRTKKNYSTESDSESKSLDNSNSPAGGERVSMCVNPLNQHMPSGPVLFDCPVLNKLPPGTTVGPINDSSGAGQDGNSNTFVVKASYEEDTVKFPFSWTGSIGELKEEVGKRLNLNVKTFKMHYLDEDDEWILMARESDLLYCLDALRSRGSNIVRLRILDV